MTKQGARWVEVFRLERLADQSFLCVRVDTADLLLVRTGESVLACERACPHEQADLGRGRIVDGRLFCPRHLASFDLRTGDISAGWPGRPLQLYPVEIRDGGIWIDVAGIAT
jgi:3-phenylpropionate/trans-cinnamate dioxygenase ferredoxin component